VKPAIVLLTLAVAACTPAPETPPSPPSPPPLPHGGAPDRPAAPAAEATALGRYHWVLSEASDAKGERIAALFARADKPLQLDFVDDRLAVVNACNRMGGAYALGEGRLTVDRLVQTMMACPDPALAALDEAIGSRLQGRPELALQTAQDPPQLTLRTAQGDRLVFAGRPTAATRYGNAGERVFLEVAPQTVACSHPLIPDKQCLSVRERHYDADGLVAGAPGEWQALYQDIEGYVHEPGVRTVLRLTRYRIADPPADAPAVAYVLDTVVESEIVTR